MWIDPPPKPPQATEQTLAQLASYYRQLIAYHQQAAAIASSKLSQVESLLTVTSFTSPVPSWQYPQQSSFTTPSTPELVAELEEVSQVLPEIKLPKKDILSKTIQEILKTNQGKMIRLDYLALEVCEKLSIQSIYQLQLKTQLKPILEQGEEFGLWSSIPDSPECWTFDLSDFPDFTDSSSPKKKTPNGRKRTTKRSKNPYNRTRLPTCAKIEQYETLTGAIRECLRQHYPKPLDANEVLAWMYPDGLEGKIKTKAYQAISDGLNKGCSRQHWLRVEVGLYTLEV